MENKNEGAVIENVTFHYGQKWKERDSRFTRVVEICGMDTEKKKVKIRTIELTGPSKIERWVKVEAFASVKGKKKRFDLYLSSRVEAPEPFPSSDSSTEITPLKEIEEPVVQESPTDTH